MKALVITEKNKPVELLSVADRVVGPGQALVRVYAAALNHRDVWIQKGQYAGLKYPIVPGSDGAGVVVAVSDGGSGGGTAGVRGGSGVAAARDWIGKEVIIDPALHWGEAAAVSSPNATMVVSRTLREYYRRQYQRDTIYIPNGATVTPRRVSQRLAEWDLLPDNYVLFLGRFSPEKNCHLLISAFEALHTDMKLVLAGGSSHSDAYVESLRRHESDRIRFLPWVSGRDLEELLSNAAVFVLPSELEGLSLALLDAMAAGVCVLTSDIPENNEVVEGAGFTFRRGDEADLERMLDVLVHNPALRRQAANWGRERIQGEYLWPAIARSIEQTYFRVLGWGPHERVPREQMAIGAPVAPLDRVAGD